MRYRYTFLFIIYLFCYRVQLNKALKTSCKYNRVAKYKRILRQARWTPFAQYNLNEISRFTTVLSTCSYSLPAYIHDPELHPKVRWRQPFRQTVLSGIKVTDLVKPSLQHDTHKETALGENIDRIPSNGNPVLRKGFYTKHYNKASCLKEEIISNHEVFRKLIFKKHVVLICPRDDTPISDHPVSNIVINKTIHQTPVTSDNVVINVYSQTLQNSCSEINVTHSARSQSVKFGSYVWKNLASKPSFIRTANETETVIRDEDGPGDRINSRVSQVYTKKHDKFITRRNINSLIRCNTMTGVSSDLSELSTLGWVILLFASFILPSLIIKLCYHLWSNSLESSFPCRRGTPNKKLRTRKRNRRSTRKCNGDESCFNATITDLAEPAPVGCIPEYVHEEEDDELLDDEMASSFPVDTCYAIKPISPVARASKGITDASLASADTNVLNSSNPKRSQINSSHVSFSSLSERILKIHYIGSNDEATGHGSKDGIQESNEKRALGVERISISRYSVASSNSSEEIIQITNLQPCLQPMPNPASTVALCLQSDLTLMTVPSSLQCDLPLMTVSSCLQSDLPLMDPSHTENKCCSSVDCHLLYCSHTAGSTENDISMASSSSPSSNGRRISTETSMNTSSSGDENTDIEAVDKEKTENVMPAIICNTDDQGMGYSELAISVADEIESVPSRSTLISKLAAHEEMNINNDAMHTDTNANANYGYHALNSPSDHVLKSDQMPKNDNKIDVFSETFEEPIDSITTGNVEESNSNLIVDMCETSRSLSRLHNADTVSLSADYVIHIIEDATGKHILLPVHEIIFLLARATGISRYISRHLVLGQYSVAIANKEQNWIKRVLDECMLPELTATREFA